VVPRLNAATWSSVKAPRRSSHFFSMMQELCLYHGNVYYRDLYILNQSVIYSSKSCADISKEIIYLGRVRLRYSGIGIHSGIGNFFVCQTNDYSLYSGYSDALAVCYIKTSADFCPVTLVTQR